MTRRLFPIEEQASGGWGAWGRALVAAYAFMALAACSRSAVQIATRFDTAPLTFALSGASGAVYLLAAVALSRARRPGPGRARWRRIAATSCAIELTGVVAIGAWSLVDPGLFTEPTVWSGFGSGYGLFPLALPLLGLAWLRSESTFVPRPGAAAQRGGASR